MLPKKVPDPEGAHRQIRSLLVSLDAEAASRHAVQPQKAFQVGSWSLVERNDVDMRVFSTEAQRVHRNFAAN
jgi:hypothetical protein